MRHPPRVRMLVRLATGLLIGAACSNGASDPPQIATPTPTNAHAPAHAAEPAVSTEVTKPAPTEAPPAEPPHEPISPSPAPGERLNPAIAGLGTDLMLAAFPERVGGWSRSAAKPSPAGTAGRWADGAFASYSKANREIRVDVTDMIRVDACTPGTGTTIIEGSLAADPHAKRVTLGTHAAVLTPTPAGAALGLWLGDRCQLGLSSDDASGDQLVELGSGLGLAALAAACGRRDPTLVLGR
jgi:hypothetical protein